MGFLVLCFLAVALTVACCYYGQVLGHRRIVGAWGGLFLGFFLGPIGLLVIMLFPKAPASAG